MLFTATNTRKSSGGFSLIELMVVVGIIGILAAIALPRFRIFQIKARQAEAKTNLAVIHTLEESYRGEMDTYIGWTGTVGAGGSCPTTGNAIGFYITNCADARYGYTISSTGWTVNFTAAAASQAAASNRVAPGCAADRWTVTQDKVLVATLDNTTSC